jgi:hypothetical protein
MSLRNSKHALNNFNVVRGPQRITTHLYHRLQNISVASSLTDISCSEGEQELVTNVVNNQAVRLGLPIRTCSTQTFRLGWNWCIV